MEDPDNSLLNNRLARKLAVAALVIPAGLFIALQQLHEPKRPFQAISIIADITDSTEEPEAGIEPPQVHDFGEVRGDDEGKGTHRGPRGDDHAEGSESSRDVRDVVLRRIGKELLLLAGIWQENQLR